MTKLIFILALIFVFENSLPSRKSGNGISGAFAEDQCSNCDCGREISGKIKGGRFVQTINKYPWIANIKIRCIFCGGSLITSKHVLTAAHCVYGRPVKNVIVTLMEHDLTTTAESKTIRRDADNIFIHSSYQSNLLLNDIALISLDRPVQIGVGPGIPNPICVTRGGDSFEGAESYVLGWGWQRPNGKLSPILKEVVLPVLSNDNCQRIYHGNVPPTKLCAGNPKQFTGPLEADSGGPLMVLRNSTYTLIGIVSSGIPNIGTSKFTRVSEYVDWIQQYTAGACLCLK